MKIYKVYRTDNIDWDEFAGFVVRANNKEEALKLAQYTSDEYSFAQGNFNKENTNIEEVTNEGVAEVILKDYKAG